MERQEVITTLQPEWATDSRLEGITRPYGSDEIHHLKGDHAIYWFAPLVADAEAGFGGPLHAFEIMKNMIAEGAAGVHFEDQLASVKKCGHLGGKVLVPTSEFITKLIAARLA